MNSELKPCPFCGNEDIKIEVVLSRHDILSDSEQCIIDIKCYQCKTLKMMAVMGVDKNDCIKEAKRLWNERKIKGE